MPLLGKHNAWNAAAAVAVARRAGVPQEMIEEGLAQAKGAEMRLQRVREGGVEFINDSYNANPESMLASLETFGAIFPRAIAGGRRVAVLGDMLELGEQAEACHREIGRALAGSAAFDVVVLVGKNMRFAAEDYAAAGGTCPVTWVDRGAADYARQAAGVLRSGDAVLLKGSRGTVVDRVIGAWQELLRERAARPAAPTSTESAAAGR